MAKQKRSKTQKDSPDFQQLKENLRFIQDEIELARRSKQRKQVAHLKLKMLILKLRYNAEQLNKAALAAQALQPQTLSNRRSTNMSE